MMRKTRMSEGVADLNGTMGATNPPPHKKTFDEIVEELWEKHGSADKEGYVDLMRPSGFAQACEELRDILKEKVNEKQDRD
jgi:hypothetical protein